MQIKFVSTSASGPTSFLSKVATFILLAVFLVVALMFSAVVLAAILVIALIGGTYLWWKTRALRAHLQSQMQQFSAAQNAAMKGEPFSGEVVEGEVIQVNESRIMNRHDK